MLADFFTPDLRLGESLLLALDHYLALPNPQDSKLLACYLAQDYRLLKKCFILYCLGESRSGKSTLCKLASKISHSQILGANSTPSAIRRTINNLKRRNYILILDDWNKQTLSNNQLYQLLKNSVDVSTAREFLSSTDRDMGVIEFSTFSPKIISTTFNITREQDNFIELINRLYIVDFKRSDNSEIPQIDDEDDELEISITDHWQDKEDDFRNLYLSLKNRGLGISEWERTRPLIAVGLFQGIFKDKNESWDYFNDYWHRQRGKFNSPTLKSVILEYIEGHNLNAVETGREYLIDSIHSDTLFSYCKALIKSGYLAIDKLSNSEFIATMNELGYMQKMIDKIPKWVLK